MDGGSSWNLGAVWSVHPDGVMYRRIAWISEWCAQKQVRVARFRTASDKRRASVNFSMVRIRYRSCGVIHVAGSPTMRYNAAKAMREDSGRPADLGRALYASTDSLLISRLRCAMSATLSVPCSASARTRLGLMPRREAAWATVTNVPSVCTCFTTIVYT